MENKMKEVAKLLGVELKEEFGVEGLSFKYKLEKDGLIFWSEDSQEWIGSNLIEDLLAGKARIVKLPKQILTDAEKRYLSAVIKPFRYRVASIRKTELLGYELIYIALECPNKTTYKNAFTLPFFEKGTMYKGMKLDKEYTLGQLEL